MTHEAANPFDVTKAVDFDDQQIRDYWVDLPGGVGFRDLVKPTSPMPMFVLGGKGSGKTHLLRYFSYPLQKLRHKHAVEGLQEEGYVGVYLRCGGLNASRFSGKGQKSEAWATLFRQYMDLWLAQLYLGIVTDAIGTDTLNQSGRQLCQSVVDLLDAAPERSPQSVAELLSFLRDWQRTLDIAINNAALTRQLDAEIRISPGRLVFGIPQAFARRLDVLRGVQVLYLIDELENLDVNQQRYINTLIREKESPCSFKVGARLYGVRTYETYSAGEVNREGSEYEKLPLDDHLRSNRTYAEFATRLCARRLVEAKYLPSTAEATSGRVRQVMRNFFHELADPLTASDRFLVRVPNRVKGKPYFVRLEGQLYEGVESGQAPGLVGERDVESVLEALRLPDAPFLEKVNIFLLYKAWSRQRPLLEEARTIQAECAAFRQGSRSKTNYRQTVSHFGADLAAQLLADYSMKQQYLGFATFAEMSRGLPRNLLVLLKHVYQWALFNGEQPFREAPISVPSQQQGVTEASRWFFRDAEVLGEDGADVQAAVRRLGDLFRAIRFSDKPAECSLSTFSVNLEEITPRSRRLIQIAEQWSLLFPIGGGQRHRNSQRLHSRFQLNSMICPIWDLPIYRRGTIALTSAEIDAIFDRDYTGKYEHLLRVRIARMTAPYFGRPSKRGPLTLPLL